MGESSHSANVLPNRSTRGIPPNRFGQNSQPRQLSFPSGNRLLRTPPSLGQGTEQHHFNPANDDLDRISVASHNTQRSHQSLQSHYSQQSHHSQRSNATRASDLRSTRSNVNIVTGNARTERVLQKAASVHSLQGAASVHSFSRAASVHSVHRVNPANLLSASNELREIELIRKRALDEADRRRNEVLQSIAGMSQVDSNEFDEQPPFKDGNFDYDFISNSVNTYTKPVPNYVTNWVNKHPVKEESSSVYDNHHIYHQEGHQSFPQMDNRDKLLSDAFRALTSNKHPKNLPEFSGSIKEWPIFLSEFERSTRENNISDTDNLRRLNAALKNDARKTVLPLLTHPENVSTIINLLKKNYGQTEWVIASLIEEMKNLPNLRDENVDGFRDFYNTVVSTVTTIQNLNCAWYLANPELLSCLVQKLPTLNKALWGHFKADLTRQGKTVTIEHFSLWLEDELDAQFANYNPMSHKKPQFQSQNNNFNRKFSNFPKKATVLHQNHSDDKQNKICIVCKKGPRHPLYKCEIFMKKTVDERREIVLKNKLCFSCMNAGHDKSKCTSKNRCKTCNSLHHTVLHKDVEHGQPEQPEKKKEETVLHSNNKFSNTLLRCGKVKLKGKNGIIEIYALFDDGSTASQIEENLSNELGLEGPTIPITYHWTRDITTHDPNSKVVQMEISGPSDSHKFYHLKNVRTVNNLSLPVVKFNLDQIIAKYPNIEIEKLIEIQNAKPKLLIGSNNGGLITPLKTFSYSIYGLQLCHCRLGWTIHGDIDPTLPSDQEFSFHIYTDIGDGDLSQLVNKSYQVENFGIKIHQEKLSNDDEKAVEIMSRTMKSIGNRYEIGHLYKYEDFTFPDSKFMALRRLRLIEAKMDKNEDFCKLYCDKIQEYLDKGYAKKLKPEEVPKTNKTWYLPHFGVTNPNKPGKFRMVMDAAAKSGGYSLNDLLLKGPDLVPPLQAVLWRGRLKKVVMIADIQEMFHQVKIREEDQCSQLFLFRGKERNKEPDVYAMTAMIFGAISSPSVAQYVKNYNAKKYEKDTPGVYEAITKQHYVDDYFDSADTDESAIQIVHDVVNAHKQGGFKLVKFISNSKKLLESLPDDLKAELDPNKLFERILGLQWRIDEDTFVMSLTFEKFDEALIKAEVKPTKRKLLQFMMSIFDPLGFLSPILIKLKLIYQDLWRSDIKWDCEVPDKIFQRWKNWLNEVKSLKCIEIPRCYFPAARPYRSAELHTFCDASNCAFATIVYLRIVQDENIFVAMLSSKSKVAPLKAMTVPRLELQAAAAGSILCDTIQSELGINIFRRFFWTDSKVVKSWLETKEKLNAFVGPRKQ